MIGTDGKIMALRILDRAPRLSIVHHHDERGAWATRGRTVLFRSGSGAGGGAGWEPVARFPRASAADALGRSRMACRALRLDRCNVHPTRAGHLLGIRAGQVLRLERDRCVPLASIQGDCLMSRAVAEAPDGSLFFGEYFTNPGRRPVQIWRVSPELDRAEVAWSFEAPRIRHVHAVHPDPHAPGRLWVTMGDFAGECFLAFSDDGFRSVEWLGDGSQLWRTVGLLFHGDRVGWLTDSHLETNRVVSMDRQSGQLELHGEVASSSWYQARTTDGVHLATTTVEIGPSIRASRCFLLRSEDGRRWREAASFAKDRLPMRFFKFGSLSLPSGRYSSQGFWLSGEGVRGLDGVSVLCALEPGAAA